MSRGGRTKEERFLLTLYKAAMRAGSYDAPIGRYVVGHEANVHTRQTDIICNQLLQTNFIKKNGPDEIYLTANGYQLVQTLL